MAQTSVREYDVKKMFFESIGETYGGFQLRTLEDIEQLEDGVQYVIKPDMLFGKRGKRGLLGINLNKEESREWLKKHFQKEENIDGVDGTLDVFLVEKCVKPENEYYISFAQTREGDMVYYSAEGGVEVEDNWETVKSLCISTLDEVTSEQLKSIGVENSKLNDIIIKLWKFYKTHGFVSLECNPIAYTGNDTFVILDAVAKIDDCEWYLQKNNWKNLEFPNNYGFVENSGERKIRELDEQTGASLKMKILNPEAKIWTLFAGGGGSLVMTDTLGALGYASEVGNYGECSGNPTREFTREYTKILLEQMLGNSHKGKYLIIAGAIANFTHIDTTFGGMIDAFEERKQDLLDQEVTILVRRGGINEKKGLQLLETACKKIGIPAVITGSDAYMTEVLKEIKL